MHKASVVSDIIEQCAGEFPDKAAFINRDGSSFTFSELLFHSRFIASELLGLNLYGKAAALMGEVNYSGLVAMFACLLAGIPVVMLDASLPENEQERLISSYDISGVFYSAKHKARADALCRRLDRIYMFPELEKLLEAAEPRADISLPELSPDEPAFLFFTSKENKAAMLSHKNICENLRAVAQMVDISSYTFLSPSVWGSAFDCVMGLLFPLYSGCSVVKRGERRSVAKAISESAATALTCTPERLLSLEKSLKTKSEKKRSKAEILLSDFFAALFHMLGFDFRKQMHRKIHGLMGDNLKLIICGGSYPDKDNIRQFANWGFSVYNCYFLTECGTVAISKAPEGKLFPVSDISVSQSAGSDCGELTVSGDSVFIGYFGEENGFLGSFQTGDIGLICDDGSLEVRGKRRTMLMGGGGEMVFPEEISAKLCRSRYISRCTVTGRFDTRAAGIVVSAVISPDFKEIDAVLGGKYSENRLRLFFSRELERLSSSLPHKIDEFKLADKKPQNITEVSDKNERK